MPAAETYRGFSVEETALIKEAFLFVRSKIKQYGEERKKILDSVHHPVINADIEEEIKTITWAEEWLNQEGTRFFLEMWSTEAYQSLSDIIKSALDLYLRDTKEARTRSGVSGFDSRIQELDRVLGRKFLIKGRSDLFDRYYTISSAGRKEVFLSYSNSDKALAGRIAAFLRGHELDVFLAHEDIEVSGKWREEIHQHLESCDSLLALLTVNFEKSVWTNQETGHMLGRKAKIIPLIVGDTDIKRFGFLEAIQGIKVTADRPEDSFEEILAAV